MKKLTCILVSIIILVIAISCKKHEDVAPVDDYSTYKTKYFELSLKNDKIESFRNLSMTIIVNVFCMKTEI